PERRDKNQRNRIRKAIGIALARAELDPILAAVVYQLLNLCNDTLLRTGPEGAPACSGWWSLSFIHNLVYPPYEEVLDEAAQVLNAEPSPARDEEPDEVPTSAHRSEDLAIPEDLVEDLGDDGGASDGEAEAEAVEAASGARTAGRWMATLVSLGWVKKIHRQRIVNGAMVGTSNLWLICIPDHLRVELHASEDAARASAGSRPKTKGGPGRHSPRSGRGGGGLAALLGAGEAGPDHREATAAASAARIRLEHDIRLSPCGVCEGDRWIDAPPPSLGVITCPACGGKGTSATSTAPPPGPGGASPGP
ncbi:MAG: hypothetical protein ACRDOH_32950, partial [Streptosporangiaceae bacterium]